MDLTEEDYLAHYGILRKSGRYPWGSGANPNQRSKTFLDITNDLRKQGMSDTEIAKAFDDRKNGHPFTVSDLRALRSRSTNIQKRELISQAQRLRDRGMSPSAIARQMGRNESTIRSFLEPGRLEKLDVLESTAAMLKRQVEEKGMIDVGSHVNLDLPIGNNPTAGIAISPDKFNTALSMLKEEGYQVHTFKKPQVGTGEMTTYKVLVKPGVTQKEAFLNADNLRQISEKTDDRGKTWTNFGIQPPLSIDSKRIGVRYKEDGGADADGVIYVRPGVKDVELGKSHYAQVRIAVDGTHYMKGMAVYKDDLPPGVDLMFNTNKSNTGHKLDALKELKKDPETGEVDKDNPFGAVIKQGGQILGKDGKVSSAMNLINEEGDWDKWSRNIAPQVLSKQQPELIKSQLDRTYQNRLKEFETIRGLTNPQIKQKLLDTFGDETDAAAVHLKAAAMPNQATKVILPSNHVKPNEIFAPTYENGTRVALVRYPHAGTFEIPELTVNNRSRDAQKLVGMGKGKGGLAPDVVVIHPKVAQHLSGADFDGDSVVVIPNNRGQITKTHPLDNLKNFDPQEYKVPTPKEDPANGRETITASKKGLEMGNVTNLISDMTLRGATQEELGRAVRHSMVVIDSEKHNLDWQRSARDHGILDLKRRYQGTNPNGTVRGASTLITKAKSEERVNKRKPRPAAEGGPIDRATGEKKFVETGEHVVRFKDPATGRSASKNFRSKEAAESFAREQPPSAKPRVEPKQFKSTKLAETHDAFSLVSEGRGTVQEAYYAEHSNRLKALANQARKEMVNTKTTPYSKSAKAVYSHEVESLNSKLRLAQKNAPLERQAQAVANQVIAQRRRANPGMEADELKKIRSQALSEARLRTGASKTRIGSKDSPITDREWQAIQAGAISNHKLEEILKHSDIKVLRERATPRENLVMTPALTSRAKSMLNSGFTPAEIAQQLGVNVSTLKSSLAEGGE